MSGNYILDERGQPQLEPDVIEWAKWFEKRSVSDPVGGTSWRVGYDQIGNVHVSTVFLGLDHAFNGGPSILWETLVRGGELDGDGDRYCSRASAEDGHARWVEKIKELEAPSVVHSG